MEKDSWAISLHQRRRLFLLKFSVTLILMVVMASAIRTGSFLTMDANPALAAQTPEIQQPTISFSHNSVVSRGPFQLRLIKLTEGTIRFTTNGALPDGNSAPYITPIAVNKSMVIRAQVFNQLGEAIGDVYTKSYLIINYDQTIPIISIVADWIDLDFLHANPDERGEEWERPMNMEYFAPGGQVQFNVKAGIRIHGGRSRLHSQKKSYRIYFRKSYGGPGNLEYPLFADTLVTKFDKLVLRAGYNDSFNHVDTIGLPTVQAQTAKYIGDQVVRNLHRDMGQLTAHGSWVLLYINGEFWGLYNLTERIDLQFLRSYSDSESDWDVISKNVGITAAGEWYNYEAASEGDDWAWHQNQIWLGSADFSNHGNIGVLEWLVDMENVFSYMFLQAYVQNYDWPGNNWIVYRRKDWGFEGQWRMIVWDAEYSFGNGNQGFKTDINVISKIYSPHDSITRFLEKPFIRNCALKHRFVTRAREYLGVENLSDRPETEVGQLSKERVKAEILEQAAIVRPFIQMEADRWMPNMGLGVEVFDQNIENALRFVDAREEIILGHLDALRDYTFTECQ